MEQADVRPADRRRASTNARFGKIVLVLSVGVAVAFCLRAWAGWARREHDFVESLVTVGVGCAGIFLAILTLLCWRNARNRTDARVWKSSFVILVAGGAALGAGFALDTPSRAVRRAQPIVDAILRFRTDFNAPPKSLEELVPRYSSAVPEHFTRTFQSLHYFLDDSDPRGFGLVIPGCSEWGLSMIELRYEPGVGPVPRAPHHLTAPRRIGDWILSESGF